MARLVFNSLKDRWYCEECKSPVAAEVVLEKTHACYFPDWGKIDHTKGEDEDV